MDPALREKSFGKWKKAVQRTMDWVDPDEEGGDDPRTDL
jgi:hypothetical protein